jgi:hypothetical protein
MAKDPAFLFYPSDWIGGTIGMTFEEKGAYMELLMMQFNRGHMTKHMIGQVVGQLWVKLEDKFSVDEHGKYYNLRLEFEKEKRKRFTKSRRNNISGENQHTKDSGHMTEHMENVNINVNNTNTNDSIIYWESEKKTFLSAGDWTFKFCCDKNISLEFYDECAAEYISDIELKEDFKSAKELRGHFTSWFNKYKKNGHKSINGSHTGEKLGTSAARVQKARTW